MTAPAKKQSPRTVVGIFALASFLHDIGSDMVFSVWPLYVRDVLGFDMALLGLVDGLGDAVVSVSQAVSGYVSDRIRKRKVFIIAGYFLGGISRLGYAAAGTLPVLIVSRLVDRSGKMRGAPRDAIVSEHSTDANRGRHFGILRLMDNAGAAVGILLAVWLLPMLGYRNLFLVAAVPSFIAVAVVWACIRETPDARRIFKGMRFADLNANTRLYMLLMGVFSLGSFSYSFLMVYAGTAGFSFTTVPLLYLLFTVVAAIVSVPFGKLSDRYGRKSVIFLSLACWVCVGVALVYGHSMVWIAAAFAFYGLHKGAMEPVQRAFMAELAPPEYVASAIGGLQLVIGLLSLPASLIAGVLWDKFGSGMPFVFSIALTLLSGVMLLFVRERAR